MPNPEPLLDLRGLVLDRDGAGAGGRILTGVDLRVDAGQWLVLLGENGSGKTSLLTYLAQDGSPVASCAVVLQDPQDQLVAGTVRRELVLGRELDDPDAVLDEFGLGGLGDRDPRELSAGQQQRLALAVAVAADPDLLLCDEPTALQDRQQAVWVLDYLDRWRRRPGKAVISATQDEREVARSDRLLLLASGRAAVAGASAELRDHEEIARVLGRGPATAAVPGTRATGHDGDGGPRLALEGLRLEFPSPGTGTGPLDLTLAGGRRLGVTGPNGCGKSTLLATCAGLRRPDEGRVVLGDRRLYGTRCPDLEHGLALLAPQFPERLFTFTTVAGEIALDRRAHGHDAAGLLSRVGLPADLGDRHPHALSTGQQRRLALALVIGSGRPVLLLDEPTAALDARGRRLVLDLLDQVPATAAVVVASHDHAFLEAAGCEVRELGPGGWS